MKLMAALTGSSLALSNAIAAEMWFLQLQVQHSRRVETLQLFPALLNVGGWRYLYEVDLCSVIGPSAVWLISATLVPNWKCPPLRRNSADSTKTLVEASSLRLFRHVQSFFFLRAIMLSRVFRPQSALRAVSPLSQVRFASCLAGATA